MNPVLLLLSLCGAVIGLSMRAVEPMLPALSAHFQVSIPEAGLLLTVFALTYAFGQFLIGPLGERYGKLRITTFGIFACALVMFGCASAETFAGLAAWRVLTGLAGSGPFVLGMAYIGDTVPIDKRGTAIAHYVIGNVLGHAFGPMISGIIADTWGWRATFVLHGVLFSFMGIALAAMTRGLWASELRGSGRIQLFAPYMEVLKHPPARMLSISAMIEALFFFGAFAFVGAAMKEKFDLSLAVIGVALAGFGLGGVIFNVGVRWFARHFDHRGQVLWGGLLCGSMYVVVAILPYWQPIIPCMILVGLGFYMMHNVLQTRGTEAAPRARGVGMALFGITWTLGQAIGIGLMGAGIAVVGFTPMIAVFGVGFMVLGIWMRINFHRLP